MMNRTMKGYLLEFSLSAAVLALALLVQALGQYYPIGLWLLR